MSQFRGYAQKSSVQSNIIKVPDTSEKILQESKRYLQQWSKVSQQEQSKRETYLSQLESNFQKEEEERTVNRKLRQHYADDFKKALLDNHQVRIDGAAKAASEQQKRAQEMAAFSSTLAKGLANVAQGYVNDRVEYGKNLAIQYDISETDVKHLRNLDGQLEDYEGKNNELINELLSKGASFERINQIKNLSGWSMRGVREGEVVRAAENYETYYYNKYNDPIELPNGLGTMSLGAAEAAKDIVSVDLIQGIIAGNYWNQDSLKHISKNQISQHASEKVALVHGRTKTFMHQEIMKNAKEAEHRTFKDILATKYKTGGWKAAFDMTALQGGKTGFATAESRRHKTTVELFQEGVLNETHLNEALKYTMKPRDGGKPVLWHERNAKKFYEYKKAFNQYEREQAQIRDLDRVVRESEEKAEAESTRSDIISKWETIPNIGMYLANEMKKAGPNTHLQKMYAELQGLALGNVTNDSVAEPILWDLLNKKTLTRDDVIKLRMSPKATNTWLKKADENSPFTFSKEENSIVKSQSSTIVEDILKQYGAESKSVSSSPLAKEKIKGELGKYFKVGIIKGMSRYDALVYAKSQVDQDVADGLYDIVERKIIRKDGREITVQSPEFKMFSPGNDTGRDPYPYSNITSEDVRANPDILETQAVFPREMVERYYKDVSQGKHEYPPAVLHFITKFGTDPKTGALRMTPANALEAQYRLMFGEEPPDSKELDSIEQASLSQVSPEYHRTLLGSHATRKGTTGILVYEGVLQEDKYANPYKQQLIANYKGTDNPHKFSTATLELIGGIG